MLEGFDEDKRRYIEYGTTDCLHTLERCKEAKAKLQAKNDHGNEAFATKTVTLPIGSDSNEFNKIKPDYVDHTLKPELKLKILVDPTAEGLAKQYNSFEKPIKFSQYQLAPSLYTIAVYYEEVK